MTSKQTPKISPHASCSSADVAEAAEFVRGCFGLTENDRPKIGVILGSGLGESADRLRAAGGVSLAYSAIPGMPTPHVLGHVGRLVYGRVHNCPVVMLQGRVHFYEGHSIAAVQFGTRLLHALGISTLIVSNAAGGIRDSFSPGDLMLICSHLRPLTAFQQWHSDGSDSEFSARFDDLLWSETLRRHARAVESPLKFHEGVYAMMSGPNYETPAEIRAMQRLGADAVGMSTVPEALLAAKLGVQVLGISCITNAASGLSASSVSHADVTATAASVEGLFVDWLWKVIRDINASEIAADM